MLVSRQQSTAKTERVLVLIKPDAVERGLAGQIISRFENVGLKIVAQKLVEPKASVMRKHYPNNNSWLRSIGANGKAILGEIGVRLSGTDLDVGRKIRKRIIKGMVGRPVLALVLEGPNAISVARKIAGSSSPKNAAASTIRGDFSTDHYGTAHLENRLPMNLVHVSDPGDEERQIKIWFGPGEIINYMTTLEKSRRFDEFRRLKRI